MEQEHLDLADFRAFTFANPVELWCSTNPNFFAGTIIEGAAGPVTVESGNGSVTVASRPGAQCKPILLRTSAGHGIVTALSERVKQLADIYSFLFAQLDMPANAKR